MVRSLCRIAAAALLTGAVTLIGAPRTTVRSLGTGAGLPALQVIEVAPPGTPGCTLIDAIHAANADMSFGGCTAGSGSDLISVPAGVYTLTGSIDTTHGLATGLPPVVSHLTIVGAGPEATIIERAPGSPEFRLLRVWHVGASLTLRGVTIRGGHGSGSGGGGIYANGPLSVHDARFEENHAGTHGGGAIRWSGWPLTISNTTFANNRAPAYEGGAIMGNGDPIAQLNITGSRFEGNYAIYGGAITYAGAGPPAGAGSITDSVFTANTALHGGGAMQVNGVAIARVTVTGNRVTAPGTGGAGLYVDGVTIADSTISNNVVLGPAGGGGVLTTASALARRVTITGTTFAGNSADTGGGAALGGLSTLANVTFSGNESSGYGGALHLGGGQADLNNVTIAGNRSIIGRAGGIGVSNFTIVRLRNTLVSGNFDALDGPDCHSTGHPLQSLGYNLVGVVGACNYQAGPGDLVGTSSSPIDARLGPLRDNGGPTWTLEPAATSPAVDGGSPGAIGADSTACDAVDQRGAARPERAACDIGAFERKNRAPEVAPDRATTAEDTSVGIVMTATDEDGDALTVAVSGSPLNGVLTGNFPSYSYTPAHNFNGVDSFTVLARDALGASRSVTVTITVTPANDPPAAVDDEVTVPANATAQSIPVLDNDSSPDAGEVLAVTALTLPAHGIVAIGAGGTEVTYMPAPTYSGADTFTYTVSDGSGLTATARVFVAVVPSADLAVAVTASPTAVTGGPLSYLGTATNRGIIAASNAVVSFTFPSPPNILAQPAGCAVSGPVLTCAVGPLSVGQSANVSVSIEAPVGPSITTAVSVEASETDPRLDNNTVSVTTPITPAADLILSVTDEPDPVAVGESLAYRVVVRNRAGITATSVKIAATFPASGGGTEVNEYGLTPLPPGSETTTLIVRVPQTSGVYNAHFSVTASQLDPAPLNNAESEQTIVGTAVAVVNSTGHAGDLNPTDTICDTGGSTGTPECTLRAAIETANTTPGTIIAFRIPAGERGFADDVFTIQPGNNLPAITADGTIVEATTQTSFTGDTNPLGPEIVLRGDSNRDASPTGLRIEASNVVVRGLVINGFVTDAECTAAVCGRGIFIANEQRLVTGTRIEGNYVGLNRAGAAATPNGRGIEVGVGAEDTLIGGTAAGHGNVISGNAEAGIFLDAPGDRTTIHGNFVGTNRGGTLAVPNGAKGGLVINGANRTVVGGAASGAGNVISGNSGFGVAAISLLRPAGPAPIQTSISGNLIGTDVTGTLALGNKVGVLVSGDGQWLAGTMPGIHNIISGNRASGVVVTGEGRSFILGNYIGTDITGLLPLPNGGATASDAGVKILSGTSAIGGYGFGDANVIAFNNGDGVIIDQQSSLPALAAVRGNSIHGNARLGIDVGGNGVSAAAVPLVTAVGNVGATAIVTGAFLALPNQPIGVELFGNTACDASGYGEGTTSLHTLSATADASGHGRFRAVLAGALDPMTPVTAVATSPSGKSSEFSACTAVGTGLSDLAVELTPSRDPAWSGFDLTWQVKVTNTGAANSDVGVATAFPAGLTYSPLPSACTNNSDVVTCTASALASGASVTFDIVVKPNVADPMTVTASVAGHEPDSNSANDSASVTLPVVAVVVIEVTEQISVTDQPAVTPSVMLTLSEQIGVVDLPVVTPSVLLTVAEQIGVTDTPGGTVLNTPAGPNVIVQPVDPITGTTPISVAFSSVVQPGTTTVSSGAAGAPIPAGFRAGTPAAYYDVSTTASVSGLIQVCINYAGVSFAPSNQPRLFHFEFGAWIDRTTSSDAATTTVCGIVTSLSPFALFTPDTIAPAVEGRMTGNGEITDAATREHRFDLRIAERSIGHERGKLTYSVKTPKPGNQKGRTDDFESTAIGPIVFWDDPSFRPGNGRQPTSDSATFAGTGRWNGKAGYTFEARASDHGEPGQNRDTFAITVRDSQGAVVATINDTISRGNIQSQRLPGR